VNVGLRGDVNGSVRAFIFIYAIIHRPTRKKKYNWPVLYGSKYRLPDAKTYLYREATFHQQRLINRRVIPRDCLDPIFVVFEPGTRKIFQYSDLGGEATVAASSPSESSYISL